MVNGEGEGGNRDLGQRSRESKWIMIGFNQISTTNKIFPRTPNRFTIHTSHDLPTFQQKIQHPPRLFFHGRAETCQELVHRFRGKRYKHRTPVAKAEKSVGGPEATIRTGKTREGEHRRE